MQLNDCRLRISLPVQFVEGDRDLMNSVIGDRYGVPRRAACANLTVTDLDGAHWLPLECKADLVRAIRIWLDARCWPRSEESLFVGD